MRFALLLLANAAAHSRLECPPPRSASTGAKAGPCDASDNLSQQPYPMHPGLNTITWLESLGHPGAPGRLALSLDGSDEGFETCVILDHIPHDEHSNPGGPGQEMSYHRSSVTIWLPDVKCERCNLQLITYMTDEAHGVPKGAKCVSPAALDAGTVDSTLPKCGVVYHSCAPISIDGSTLRKDHTCDLAEHNKKLAWPFQNPSRPTETATSTYLYKGDAGLYSKDTSRIQSSGAPIDDCPTFSNMFYCDPSKHYNAIFAVPSDAKYASLQGTCAAVVDMEVEKFVLGEVPSTRKKSGKSSPNATLAPATLAPVAPEPSAGVSVAGHGAVSTWWVPLLLALLAAAPSRFADGVL